MVNRVKLVVLNQLEQVGEFESRDALGLEKHSKTANKVVDVRYMGQHVVGDCQIC